VVGAGAVVPVAASVCVSDVPPPQAVRKISAAAETPSERVVLRYLFMRPSMRLKKLAVSIQLRHCGKIKSGVLCACSS